MLNELQPDLRELLDLVRKVENFDATLAASQMPATQSCRRRTPTRSGDATNSASSSCATSGPSRSEEKLPDYQLLERKTLCHR